MVTTRPHSPREGIRRVACVSAGVARSSECGVPHLRGPNKRLLSFAQETDISSAAPGGPFGLPRQERSKLDPNSGHFLLTRSRPVILPERPIRFNRQWLFSPRLMPVRPLCRRAGTPISLPAAVGTRTPACFHAEATPAPARIANVSFGRGVSHTAPAAARRTTESAPESWRTTHVAPPPRPRVSLLPAKSWMWGTVSRSMA